MNSLVKGAPRERCPPRGPTSERHCDRCGTIFGPLGVDYDCCTVHSTRMCMTCDCPECIPLTTEEEEGGCRSQPSEWVATKAVETAIPNAIRSLERDRARCIEWRDQNAQGSASFAFHNQAVKQCDSDIESLRALLPPNTEAKS